MTEQVGLVLRYVNIVLGLIVFLWLLGRTVKRREEYPREVFMLLTALLAFVFALLVVSAERIVANTPVTITLFIITVAKSYLLFTLLSTRTTKYRTGTRLGGVRDVGQDQNRDVFDPKRAEDSL